MAVRIVKNENDIITFEYLYTGDFREMINDCKDFKIKIFVDITHRRITISRENLKEYCHLKYHLP